MHTGKTITAAAAAALLLLSFSPSWADSNGNTKYESYAKVKSILMSRVFSDHKETLYCSAAFDDKRRVDFPKDDVKTPSQAERGFASAFFAFAGALIDKMEEAWNTSGPKNEFVRGIVNAILDMLRGLLSSEKEKTVSSNSGNAYSINWEHIVPAEHFGRNFREWREGSEVCVEDGRAYKGRKCAEKASREFRLMHADMYNLYPAVDAVNKARGNLEFAELGKNVPNAFGSCAMKIRGSAVEPPEASRGIIARTYKYMAWAYPRYKMSASTEKLMNAWDNMHPATDWECRRARRIAKLQGNTNPFTEEACRRKDAKAQ